MLQAKAFRMRQTDRDPDCHRVSFLVITYTVIGDNDSTDGQTIQRSYDVILVFGKVLGPWADIASRGRSAWIASPPGRDHAANHLSVIDDGVIRAIRGMVVGKAIILPVRGSRAFKKWWFTSVGVFPVDRAGGLLLKVL